MDLDVFRRQDDGTADPEAATTENVTRAETTIEANDGQQYRVIILDADDSFDVVVTYPDNEREIVWSLVRERHGQ